MDRDILKDWNILLQRTSKHQGQNLIAVAEYVLEFCGGRTEFSHGTVRNTHVWVGISLGLRDPKSSIRVIHWSSASRCNGKIDYIHKQICSGTIMDIDEWTSGSSLWNMKVLRTLNLLWFSDIWMDYLQKTLLFTAGLVTMFLVIIWPRFYQLWYLLQFVKLRSMFIYI